MDGCMEAYRAPQDFVGMGPSDGTYTLAEIRKEFSHCLVEIKFGHVLVWRNTEVRNETFLRALFIQDARRWVRIKNLF